MSNSIYSEFDILPSEPTNQFRALKGEVMTVTSYGEREDTIVFTVADGQQVAQFDFSSYLVPVGMEEMSATELSHPATSLADLEAFNSAWTNFYGAAKEALGEAVALLG